MAVIDSGVGTAGKADVTATFDLKVRPPTTKENTGFVGLAGIVDDGANFAGVPRANRVYVSESQKLATGHTTILSDDDFSATAQNTAKYKIPATTQTVTFSGGLCALNGSSITTVNTNSAIQSYKYYPLFGNSELRCTISAQHSVVPQVNAVTEFGLFSAVLPGAAAPTDGIFFRYNAAAELRGVISYAGTETQTAAITAPSIAVNHVYQIVTQTNVALFYIDGVLVGKLALLTDAPGIGQPFSASAQPFTARYYIGASAPTSPSQFKISSVTIETLGMEVAKPWPHQRALSGHSAYQGQNGHTQGSTELLSNSLAAGAGAAMTNTTAALGSGLGGQFTAQPTLAAGTDGIVCSYQNPAPTTAIEGRTLVITGVKIMSAVTAALTGGNCLFEYSAAFGHTAVSLATAESSTTKAPRRIVLGMENIPATAAAGVLGSAAGISQTFAAPIVVNPGEFFAIVAKNLGTVTSAGTVTFTVTIDGYFE